MTNYWVIGTGLIGTEYSKVLDALSVSHIVIGRGNTSAENFEAVRNKKVIRGGVKSFLNTKPELPIGVIIAVGSLDLYDTAVDLINYGVKKILIEKPGGDSPERVKDLYRIAQSNNVEIFLAYNRRFYASVLQAEKIIKEDGGVLSFNFEFTEWIKVIQSVHSDPRVLSQLFFGNSTHVVDTAFFLGGEPTEMTSYYGGNLSWHKPSIYSGAGRSETGALFSYQANWESPGRWVIEILTPKHRLYFKPMEMLQIQEQQSVKVQPVEIDDHLDKEYKPGFFLETQAFVNNDYSRFCSLEFHVQRIDTVYYKMMGRR